MVTCKKSRVFCPLDCLSLIVNHGVQSRMVLVDNFFDCFLIKLFCLFVATCDLVHDVQTTFHLP